MESTSLFLPIRSFFITLLLFRTYLIDDSKVRKGSSLSSSYPPKQDHTYWLSPSGNFAFGFYPLCTNDCHQDPSYVVGIWLVKTENKTLVWSSNRNDPPLDNLSSIVFDGKLILETKSTKMTSNQIIVEQKPLLPGVYMSAAYAKLNDNGNFVLYNYKSEIIWQSFDHPTNTILGGQQLSTGQTLTSDNIWRGGDWEHSSYTLGVESDIYGLIRRRRYGLIKIQKNDGSCIYESSKFLWDSNATEPVTLNLDATDGRLYLVNGNNVVLQNLTQGDENKCVHDTIIYRGTLDSDGIFRLHKERMMGSKGAKSIVLWDTSRPPIDHEFLMCFIFLVSVILILEVYILHLKEKIKKDKKYRTPT